MTTDDDDWARWIAARDDSGGLTFDAWAYWFAEQAPPDDDPTLHPGCLLVVGVCVLLWLLIIVGAVALYPG